jgi:hypothetical protein
MTKKDRIIMGLLWTLAVGSFGFYLGGSPQWSLAKAEQPNECDERVRKAIESSRGLPREAGALMAGRYTVQVLLPNGQAILDQEVAGFHTLLFVEGLHKNLVAEARVFRIVDTPDGGYIDVLDE